MFILQHKFTMDKSKLKLGANVRDIPRGVNRPEVYPGRTRRFIGNPAGGSEERQDPVAQRAVHEGRFILWWAVLQGMA